MYNIYFKEIDLIIYLDCKKGYSNIRLQKEGIKPGSIQSSLTKLLRMGYIDGDYKVIKDLKIEDITIKIGKRLYITYGECENKLNEYKKLFKNYNLQSKQN